MRSREIVRLFFLTLCIGGVSTIGISLLARFDEYYVLIQSGELIQIVSLIVWFISVGFMFSLISQMGFFAYLTIHRTGIEFFRSKRLWNIIQIILIFVVLGDFLQYLRNDQTLIEQLFIVVGLVLISTIVAYLKMLQTNREAFIPTIFFMIVVTLIEWIPAIQADDNERWLFFMLIPLLICNGFQLFMLHSLQKKRYSK